MGTVSDLINGSLRLLGVLANGEAPSATEANDAFNALNDLIDSWSTQNLLIYSKIREVFPFVVGQQTYTMGTGGNFNTARPQKIEEAYTQYIEPTLSPELKIEIVDQRQFADIITKTVQSSIPTRLYFDPAYPLANLNFWPVPNVANNVVLYSWKPLSEFTGLTEVVSLPPGYERALRFNLAMELSPEYGKMPSEVVALGASDSMASIKRMNTTEHIMSVDPALSGPRKGFNWLTGDSE